MDANSSARTGRLLLAIIGLAMVGLLARVAYLQTFARDKLLAMADRQQHASQSLPARRGSLFDRNGLLLAGSVRGYTVFADPKFMFDQHQTGGKTLADYDKACETIARLLDLNATQLITDLGDKGSARYLKLAEDVDDRTAKDIEKLRVPGIGIERQEKRIYPMGAVAAHILGGVGSDGHGLEGMEKRCEPVLTGQDGHLRTRRDAANRTVSINPADYAPADHGKHVVLTIDATIQTIAEEELAAQCQEFLAESGSVVILDPASGQVLAMANYPSYSPQQIGLSPPDLRRNRVLTDPYEPGSVIKPFIVAGALESHVVRLEEIMPTGGKTWRTSYGRKIEDVHGYDHLAVWDVLVKSSNIGMCMLSGRLGPDGLDTTLRRFGFGRATGVPLFGEDGGRLGERGGWTKYTPDSLAQGYEMMVTPMQLATALCAIANGGTVVEPTLVLGTLEPDGTFASTSDAQPQLARRAVDGKIADQLVRVLADIVVRGTARKAQSETYNLFGKTGTSHIAAVGGYSDKAYNSSFIGGGPAEAPRLVIAMLIRKPDKSKAHYGGLVTAPAAGRILDRSLKYLGVSPSPALPAYPPSIAAVLHNLPGADAQLAATME